LRASESTRASSFVSRPTHATWASVQNVQSFSAET